jgi:hypothetical protein
VPEARPGLGSLTVTGNSGTIVDRPNEVEGRAKLQQLLGGHRGGRRLSVDVAPATWHKRG